MDEISRLSEQIEQDALAVFMAKAGDAFIELEKAIGELPEATVRQWNEQLNSVRNAALSSVSVR